MLMHIDKIMSSTYRAISSQLSFRPHHEISFGEAATFSDTAIPQLTEH